MKRIFFLAALLVFFQPLAVLAQSVRHGTITQIKPIDNRGDDETQTHKFGRKLGTAIGGLFAMKAATHTDNGAVMGATTNASIQGGSALGGKIAGNGPSAHYMVKMKMDNGRVLTLVKTSDDMRGLEVGSKVKVSGSGGSAQITEE